MTVELLRLKGKIVSVQHIVDVLGLDAKKICQVLFVLHGIGFLVFVSANKVIYPGVVTSIHNFMTFVREKVASHDAGGDNKAIAIWPAADSGKDIEFESPEPHKRFSFNEITLNKQIIDAHGLHYSSEFVRQVINEILFDTSRVRRQDDT